MNARQQALQDWLNSGDGQNLCRVKTLNGHDCLLRDRLAAAFRAGLEAGERIAKENVKAVFARAIDEAGK